MSIIRSFLFTNFIEDNVGTSSKSPNYIPQLCNDMIILCDKASKKLTVSMSVAMSSEKKHHRN